MTTEEERAEAYRDAVRTMAKLFLQRLDELRGDPVAYEQLLNRLFAVRRDDGWENATYEEIDDNETLA